MKAIEAGAGASITDEMVRTAIRKWNELADDVSSFEAMRAAIEAALASGELVPASAVAAERERCAEIAKGVLAWQYERFRALEPASGEYVVVPRAALDWLFGEAPDADGKWFGDNEDDMKPIAGKYKRTYWWRSKFRAMLTAATKDGERA